MMKYRRLGTSSYTISEIGFGCMSLAPDRYRENESLLRSAADAGINFFDTADLYDKGENEITVGKALAPIRGQVHISTKGGNQWNPDGKTWRWNPAADHLTLAVENSLKRLNTDYIDLYMLHGGTTEDNIPEIIEVFEKLKAQGKIREYGISSIRPNVIRRWLEEADMAGTMMQYSLLDRRPEESVMAQLRDKNVSVLARGCLARGSLINKPAAAGNGYTAGEINKVKSFLARLENPISGALQFVLHRPEIASAVIGFRNMVQLAEILEARMVPIPDEMIEQAGRLLPPNKYEQHR